MPHPDEALGLMIGSPRWQAPTLLNSWVNYGAGYTDAGFYRMPNGFVRLRGLLKLGVINTPMFTLPVGCRPATVQVVATIVNGALCYVEIRANGDVVPTNGVNNYVAIDNITFQAA